MNRRISTILFLAFIAAAICSYAVYKIAGNQLHPASQPTTIKVITAAHDMAIGALIHDVDLTTADWVGALPKGAVTSKDTILNRGVVAQIFQGEPILDNRLAAAGSGGGLAATIRPGMRACAVRVDDVVGVAGFVLPGMHVDVLVNGTAPGAAGSAGPRVKTLLQNIEVLSAGGDIQKDNEGKPVQVQVVNLLVTPEQAELLSLASNQTRIQLVLRNPLDSDTPKTPSIAVAGLFSDVAPEPVKSAAPKKAAVPPPPPAKVEMPPPPRIYLVQVLNGSKKSEEKFSDKDQKKEQQ
jgi:pilus assembly protein CpaB